MVVHFYALFEGWVDDEELGVLVSLDLLGCDEYEVGGEADSAHGNVDVALQPNAVILAGLDDEKVQIRVRPHIVTSGGPNRMIRSGWATWTTRPTISPMTLSSGLPCCFMNSLAAVMLFQGRSG